MNTTSASALLQVRDLKITFGLRGGRSLFAVRGINFDVANGESLAIVGESGSGKTVTALALLRLLPSPPARVSGQVTFAGDDLLTMSERRLRAIRGAEIAMILQDAMSSLNPALTVGSQLEESLRLHLGLSRQAAKRRAVELLNAVAIPSPQQRLGAYPFELSGGMRQRVMIALALACDPRLLIVDEATTALDVSIQAQILELLRTLRNERQIAMILISHDLSVVVGIADRVMVMYAGETVELATTEALFASPRHPYTLGLLRSVPRLDSPLTPALPSIEGTPPDLSEPPTGCVFASRCPFVFDRCIDEQPPLTGADHLAACWLADGTRTLEWPVMTA